MYWFGRSLNQDEKPWESQVEWELLESLKVNFLNVKVEDILSVFDRFSLRWSEDGVLFQQAVKLIKSESFLSEEEIKATLKVLPGLLSKKSLEKRLRAEFNPIDQLDEFAKTPGFSGEVRAFPIGILLHVTAGNIFLSSIDSLIMGILTKNLNIIKVSSHNIAFPTFFAKELLNFDDNHVLANKFAIIHWPGGTSSYENIFKKNVNGIIAWGGEEMINSYSLNLPMDVKFIKFGPKISFQIITKKGLENKSLEIIAQKIVEVITPWDQSACSSPQNLFLQEGISVDDFLLSLKSAFEKVSTNKILDDDSSVEKLKEIYRAEYSELMDAGKMVKGKDFLLHFEENKFLRPSPLNRSLIIKNFKNEDDLFNHLKPFSYYLQSCSFLVSQEEKKSYLDKLAVAGVKRFAPLGTITFGMEGAPHDGVFALRELTKFIGLENRFVDYGESSTELCSSRDLSVQFEKIKPQKGYIFSSGGTTGEPKYAHFSFEEFEHISDMLAMNFRAQGLASGTKVANLFVAGNLWSSFIAVDRALEKLGAVILPIGGLCPEENILKYLHKFQPEVIMGIPSLLIKNAELSQKHGLDLKIPKVLYAGEALSKNRKAFLSKIWGVEFFGSAGYASVDAGVIGYQCKDCQNGEHHLFSDLVDLQIIDGEAVVSSYYRKTLPIKNYKTGDRIEWVENNCSFEGKKFKLQGRIDNIIQIWSCRINLEDIITSLEKVFKEFKTFQVRLYEDDTERLEVVLEDVDARLSPLFKEELYKNSRDLKDTITFKNFADLISIKIVESGAIHRNARTGKISLIQDFRH